MSDLSEYTLTVRQVAKRLNCHIYTIRRWAVKGYKIRGQFIPMNHRRIGREFRFSEQGLNAFIDELTQVSRQQAPEPTSTPKATPEQRRARADKAAAVRPEPERTVAARNKRVDHLLEGLGVKL